METSKSLTGQNTGEQLTFSQAGFPVSRFPLPDSERAKMILAGSGRKCLELYERYAHLGLLSKILLESSVWHSKIFVLRWKVKRMKSNRLLFHLRASEHGTRGIGSGSLPTITSGADRNTDYKQGGKCLKGKLRSIPTLKAQLANGPGKHGQGGMDCQTALVTLTARAWKDTPGMSLQKGKRKRLDETGRQLGYETGLKLHPNFAEAMQGFPIGWTE